MMWIKNNRNKRALFVKYFFIKIIQLLTNCLSVIPKSSDLRNFELFDQSYSTDGKYFSYNDGAIAAVD